MKILVHINRNYLHSKTYKLAFKELRKKGYKVYFSYREINKFLYKELFDIAEKQNYDLLIFSTFEDILNLSLLKFFFKKNNKLKIAAIYFHYHNLNKLSLRNFLITIFLILCPINKIYISDPKFNKSFFQKILSKKLVFLPDVFPRNEIPKIYMRNNFRKKISAPKDSIIIGALGSLTSKKSIDTFIIACSKIIPQLISNNVKIYMGGIIEYEIYSICKKELKILIDHNIIYLTKKFVDKKEFFSALKYSDSIWCFQKDYFASSGIFTRSAYFGSIPIVNKESSVGYICKKEKFGFLINPKSDISIQLIELIKYLKSKKETSKNIKNSIKWSKLSFSKNFVKCIDSAFD